MPLIDALYDWLEHAPSESADQVLAAALERAEPEYQARITGILLKRCNEAALGGLVCVLDRLPAEVQARVLSEVAAKPGGIAAAMRSSSVRSRLNAMATLERVPTPRVSYLLTYALRDGAGAVRDAAVRAGRRIAEAFLDRPAPTEDGANAAARREYDVERGQLVQALREIARTYDRHFRLELLEVCLWFADDLESELWSLLESPRSNSGRAVQDHLQLWNGPRLAGFLLQALKRAEWRRPAQLLLGGWQALDSVVGLLRHSNMLDDDEVRRGLAGVNRPRWFSDCGPDLGRLPVELRPEAPRWVASAGIPAEQKVQSLSSWLRTPDEPLRRAAVYALAALEAPEARRALRSCAGGETPIGQFARWVLASQPTPLPEARVRANRGLFPKASAAADAVADVFDDLWRLCRGSAGEAQAALLEILQEHAELVERPVRAALAAHDARERLLALRVIGTRRNAARFVRELEALGRDAVPAIRGLSHTVLNSVGHDEPAAPGEPRAGTEASVPGNAADSEALERELRPLCAGDAGLTLERVRAIRDLLRPRGAPPDSGRDATPMAENVV